MKKTTLDDNASIYQTLENKTEMQIWKEMNISQRWQYFKDYYLFKMIVGIAIVSMGIFLCWNFLKPIEKNVLYVAVFDESLDEQGTEQLQKQLEERYDADGKLQKVLIDDSFYTQKDGLTKLEVYLSNKQVDVIIADADTFQTLAGYGFMQDMKSALDQETYGKYQNNLFYTAGYQETESISFEDNETGRGEVLAYGINLSGSEEYHKLGTILKQPVAGIAVGAPNLGNAVNFVKLLIG